MSDNQAMIDDYENDETINLSSPSKTTASAISVAQIGWLICALGAAFYFYEYLLRVSPAVMTQDLMRSYHLNAAGVGNLSACYYYIYAPMQLPVGLLMDRYGPRILLPFACLCCAMGTYLFAATTHLGVAEFGRFLVGFGSAFAFVGVLKLATLWLPPHRFAVVSGMTMALGMIGGLVGENLITRLVTEIGWERAMRLSAISGLILIIAMVIFIRDRTKGKTVGTTKQCHADMRNAISSLLIIVRKRQMWINGVIGCLLYIPTSAFAELWGPSFLESVYHFSKKQSAASVSMIFLGWAVGGFLVGWISNKLQQRRLPITVGSMVAAVLLSLVFYVPEFSPYSVGVVFFIFGVFSSTQVLVFAIGHELNDIKSAGSSVAFTNMLVMMGGVLFQPVIGILLDWTWSGEMVNGVHQYSTSNYQYALSILPLGLLLAMIFSFFLNETYRKLDYLRIER